MENVYGIKFGFYLPRLLCFHYYQNCDRCRGLYSQFFLNSFIVEMLKWCRSSGVCNKRWRTENWRSKMHGIRALSSDPTRIFPCQVYFRNTGTWVFTWTTEQILFLVDALGFQHLNQRNTILRKISDVRTVSFAAISWSSTTKVTTLNKLYQLIQSGIAPV